jgi:endonuclease/exonuclease/phosphatase family metal-dependent hydrolase
VTRSSPWVGRLAVIAAAYPWSLVVLTAIHILAPARNGPLALTEVFAPHLFLAVVLLIPLAALARSRVLRGGIVVVLVLSFARFGSNVISLPATAPFADETVATVLSWNLEAGEAAGADLLDVLHTTDADIVALQELTPDHAAAIERDAEVRTRFPSRVLAPKAGVAGIGLLSRWPVVRAAATTEPVSMRAVLGVGGTGELVVINAHPYPPGYRIGPILPIPLRYGATTRDEEIRRIREEIDSDLAAGRRLVVIGDFNLTDREPAYGDLVGGLWDAHREVGLGPGATWRPGAVDFLPFGVLRIDHVFGGPGTRPLTIGEDCAPRHSDHCIVRATVAIR